jgi:hypothetical protein
LKQVSYAKASGVGTGVVKLEYPVVKSNSGEERLVHELSIDFMHGSKSMV